MILSSAPMRVKLHSLESNLTIQDVVHEVVADPIQGVDPQEKDPILDLVVHVGLQGNQSLPLDHQRRENQSLQGVPDPVLVPVHRHKLFAVAVMYYLCCVVTKKKQSL